MIVSVWRRTMQWLSKSHGQDTIGSGQAQMLSRGPQPTPDQDFTRETRYMDTITRGVVGALAGKVLFAGRDIAARGVDGGQAHALSSPTARAAIVACTLGS